MKSFSRRIASATLGLSLFLACALAHAEDGTEAPPAQATPTAAPVANPATEWVYYVENVRFAHGSVSDAPGSDPTGGSLNFARGDDMHFLYLEAIKANPNSTEKFAISHLRDIWWFMVSCPQQAEVNSGIAYVYHNCRIISIGLK